MQSLLNKLGFLGLGAAAIGSAVQAAIFNVDAGERAIIFDRFAGIKQEGIGEGTHFRIPWLQRPIIFEIRCRPRLVSVVTGSKDLQNVNISLRILFRPQNDQLAQIVNNLGADYDERVLPSITNEVLKAVVAQFDASELITQRELVSQKVREDLVTRAHSFGIIIDDIALTHLTFGKEFSDAVEAKQVAQQEAERARFLVEKAEQTKQAAIVSAEGDALAAKLLSEAFGKAGEGLIELRRIEASEDVAYQLGKNPRITYLPHGQTTLLQLPAAQ